MNGNEAIDLWQDQDASKESFRVTRGEETRGFTNPGFATSDRYPLRPLRKGPTESHGQFFLIEGSTMSALKKRFKEKLERAKKIREQIGDPITIGKSIIEIPEEEADRKLSDYKGYKYVSKKS